MHWHHPALQEDPNLLKWRKQMLKTIGTKAVALVVLAFKEEKLVAVNERIKMYEVYEQHIFRHNLRPSVSADYSSSREPGWQEPPVLKAVGPLG